MSENNETKMWQMRPKQTCNARCNFQRRKAHRVLRKGRSGPVPSVRARWPPPERSNGRLSAARLPACRPPGRPDLTELERRETRNRRARRTTAVPPEWRSTSRKRESAIYITCVKVAGQRLLLLAFLPEYSFSRKTRKKRGGLPKSGNKIFYRDRKFCLRRV